MKRRAVNGKNLPQKNKANDQKCVSLGPVENLEAHVRSDWWKKIFNSLYLKTDGDVVNDQKITEHEVSYFIDILGLKGTEKILDLCCGQGRHSLELTRRNFKDVYGLDKSGYLIRKARALARKENLNTRFREGDARKLPYHADTYDVVMILGNSFGYFDSIQDDLKVLKEVFRVLKPWGKIFLDVTDGEYLKSSYKPRSWEWIDKKFFVCRERSLSLDQQRLISREIITEVDKGVIADQFYAERLYSKEGLIELLKKAGFSEIDFYGQITPDSQRNQDLGMMERRILVSAVVKKEWSPIKYKAMEEIRDVVVIFGDPTKHDVVKPDSVFDDDDLYTIDQLKSALKEIRGYRFTYLNNHNALIWDLVNLKPKIDYALNLCDEGYDNDARKELHVPALLEMLNIPYSGAGPQSLAFCYDKSLVRGIAKEMDIPVPEGIYIKQDDSSFEITFNFPVFVKPNFGDSSFGITQTSYATNSEELLNAISGIRQKFGYDKPILIEEFLTGNDISVGIIGNPPESYRILPIIEEDYSCLPDDLPKICGYEAKWLPDTPYWNITSIPAQIPEDTKNFIAESSMKLFKRLECRDYCRFDWRLDASDNPKLLEVNPNPGWCWDGHLAKMAKLDGLSYSNMLGEILKATEMRLGIQPINGYHNIHEEAKVIETETDEKEKLQEEIVN
jgi:D-alanine-D-alanine ligase